MTNSVVNEFIKEAAKTKEWLVGELAKIRTGRATPSFLDAIRINSYGSELPLNQVGSVTAEDAKTLRVAPWDTSTLKDIETAINKADLGVSVSTDERGVRVHFPDLTAETRERIAKSAKQKHEDARVALRSARDDARSQIQTNQKDSVLSEDEAKSMLDQVEKHTQEMNKVFDELFENKYQELTTL